LGAYMKLILPLFVDIPRKKLPAKRFYLGLNPYRNTHFHVLNAAKILWKDIVATAISKTQEKIATGSLLSFRYTIYPPSNRKFEIRDISNVCSIIDKFTCDALIEFGVISDDSYKVIPKVIYEFGAVDKENPHCELLINSIIAEHKPEISFKDLPF